MADRRSWIEVALNGPWGREKQPRAPIAVEAIVREGIAAAEAGAAIVHFHAFDEATGRQKDDWQLYARIIEGIRARVDVIAYPTIPLAGSGFGTHEPAGAAERYRHVDELGRRGLIEWAVCDPGTVDFARYDAIAAGEAGFVYLNPEEHIREGLRLAAEHRVRPSFAIYEPGFARLGAALVAARGDVPRPIYRLMFSEEYAWGFPPRDYALAAYLALLGDVAAGAPWMIAGLGVRIEPLVERTLAAGGHLRTGLEDVPLGTDRSNLDLVRDLVAQARACGFEPATAAEIRRALERHDRAAAAPPGRDGSQVRP